MTGPDAGQRAFRELEHILQREPQPGAALERLFGFNLSVKF